MLSTCLLLPPRLLPSLAVSIMHALAENHVTILVFLLLCNSMSFANPLDFLRSTNHSRIVDFSWNLCPVAADIANEVSCVYPLFDYVPPDLINLIISNM